MLTEAFEEKMKSFLVALCRDNQDHAYFLNSVSYMEFIGSRKIVSSHEVGAFTESILRHYSEESRHAFFFRRMADKISKRPLSYQCSDLIAKKSCEMYMGRLDAYITRSLRDEKNKSLPYLYVTCLVELRAEWLYQLYQRILEEVSSLVSLKPIITEELAHLEEMRDQLLVLDPENGKARIEEYRRYESGIFQKWFESILRDLAARNLKESHIVPHPEVVSIGVGGL